MFAERQVNMSAHSDYYSFLLRFRRDGSGHPWRIALHAVGSGEKFVFTDIRALFAFLSEQLSADAMGEHAGQVMVSATPATPTSDLQESTPDCKNATHP